MGIAKAFGEHLPPPEAFHNLGTAFIVQLSLVNVLFFVAKQKLNSPVFFEEVSADNLDPFLLVILNFIDQDGAHTWRRLRRS